MAPLGLSELWRVASITAAAAGESAMLVGNVNGMMVLDPSGSTEDCPPLAMCSVHLPPSQYRC